MPAVPSDTIVACATPPGVGAIAVLRLSGREARCIGARVAPAPRARESHKLCRARLVDASGRQLDDAMVVEMHAPRSYTGEDVVELHVHGSPAVVHSVLAACQAAGARLAEPGEFTLRAFVNGRMDLAQVEGVADLLAATTEAQQRIALSHVRGGLAAELQPVLERLEGLLASWRAALDFPEHPTGHGWERQHREVLRECICRIQKWIDNACISLRRGRHVVLCGAPNVGKSSLLNAWAGERRVLVDDAPGTTRDPVEVELTRGVVRWSLWDTAGVRADAQGLEQQGIELSFERARRADLALWLVAPNGSVWPPDDLQVVVVGSKADLARGEVRAEVEAAAERRGLAFWGWVSARSGEGVEALRLRIEAEMEVPVAAEGLVIVRERQVALLREALAALERADAAQAAGQTLDVLAMELEMAVRDLGQLLGRDVDLDVLDRIFSDFCIGK